MIIIISVNKTIENKIKRSQPSLNEIKTKRSRILIFTALIGKASVLIVIEILLTILVNELIRKGTYLIIEAK